MENVNDLPYLIAKCKDKTLQKIRAKEIVLDKKPPVSHSEYELKQIADSHNYLMNHTCDSLDDFIFKTSYYLLTNTKLSSEKSNKLKELYYLYKNFDLCEVIVEIIYEIGKSITLKKLEYALLLTNYFFVRRYGYQIKVPQIKYRDIKKMFNSREQILEILMFMINISNSESLGINEVDTETIIAFFRDNQNFLIQRYSIKNLYIFGSRANKTEHKHSDLDLLISFNDNIMSMDAILNRNKLVDYIKEKLNVSVDILFFKDAIKVIDTMSLNKILTIY